MNLFSKISGAFALLVCLTGPAHADKVVIKLGTLAPEGSVWHKSLVSLQQRWKEASKGDVELKIFPNGVAGAEGDMMRKLRIGQLQAATVTGVALGEVAKSFYGLQVPMMYDSWEQLDCVRDKFGPKIQTDMAEKGFVVLNWGDAGWVYQFSKKEATSPDDFRKMKYFVWAGDPDAEKAWRSAKFDVVPLASTDVMSSLQTGLIDSFGTTPIFALAAQWYTLAKNMVKVRWSPLNGATIISKKVWDKVDPAIRPELEKISAEEGAKLRVEIRKMNDASVDEMVQRGLKVHEPTPAEVDAWRAAAKMGEPVIRSTVVGEKDYDTVKAYAEECKKK